MTCIRCDSAPRTTGSLFCFACGVAIEESVQAVTRRREAAEERKRIDMLEELEEAEQAAERAAVEIEHSFAGACS
jgi:uncharacterized Zn finger protein (UPF0148 family)